MATQQLSLVVGHLALLTLWLGLTPASLGALVLAVASLPGDGGGSVNLTASFDRGPPTPVTGCQDLQLRGTSLPAASPPARLQVPAPIG